MGLRRVEVEVEEEGYRSGFSGRADEGGVDWSEWISRTRLTLNYVRSIWKRRMPIEILGG